MVENRKFLREMKKRTGCNYDDIEFFINELSDYVVTAVSKGETIRIKGLGMFDSKYVESKTGVMKMGVNKGQEYVSKEYYKPVFRPSTKFINTLKNKGGDK